MTFQKGHKINTGRKFTMEHRRKLAESKMGEKNPFYGKTHTEEKKQKWSKERRGNKHNWRGGITKDHGYALIRKPRHPAARKNGYILQSRFIMEKILERKLLPNEVVHHKNGITDDNRSENLQLFNSRGEHISFHNKQRKHLELQ